MGVVIGPGLVLSPVIPPNDAPNANNPLIGWHNLVTVANIVADSEDPTAPALELANAFTYKGWRSVSGAVQYINVFHNAVDDIDYMGVAAHNFGSGLMAIELQGYNSLDGFGNPDWFVLVPSSAPGTDEPIILRFLPQSLLGVRLKITPTNPSIFPRAAVVYVGKLLVLQRRIYVGHKPMLFSQDDNVVNGLNERGEFLGRLVLGSTQTTTIDQQNVTPDFYRQFVEPWRKAGITRTFFFAWRPGDYPREVAYAWGMGKMDVSNQRPNGMMSFSLNVQGITS